jgi:N-acetyl-anhydromuramoyl-L-alanine amidase
MPMTGVRSDGWVDGAARVISPNADVRPEGVRVSLVVIHNISLPPGRYGGGQVERLFTNGLRGGEHPFTDRLLGARVSAHFFISRDGRCTQFVSCLDRAWHAGVSSFRGRPQCNDFSIGIELEGTDFEPYADAQYDSLNALLKAIIAAFPIEAVVGHCDVSGERKTDPGPFFRWDLLEILPALRAR